MRIPTFEKTTMLTPTSEERLTANPAVVFSLFFLVTLISQTARSGIFDVITALFAEKMNYPLALLIELFATLSTVAAVLLFCLLVERRPLHSLGFIRKGAVSEYLVGLAGGIGMFGGAVLLCVATGTATIVGSFSDFSPGMLGMFFLAFVIQGMSEEMLCRSYLMVSLSRGWPLWVCAVLNALLFSLLHLANPGISVIALINIFLFGLFASFLTLRRGSIWMIGALHSMWNFAQGNLFGIPVSGISGLPSPLTTTLNPGTLPELINGGAFGLEGGLAVTVVLAISCLIVLFVPTKKSEIAENT